jgi:two-component system, cell cycle response regulator DivK
MKATIIYIEDNDNNFYLVNFILQAKGFELIRARDGEEGIDLANKITAELILLDIQLPVMDGYAVARALRANSALAQIPIVALTSYAMTGDREKAFEAGCTGYIEKPINPQTFSAQIEEILSKHTSGGNNA